MFCVVYFIGVLLYRGWLTWKWISEGLLPDLPWWQHLLAPLGIVVAWLGMEILGLYVANGFPLNEASQGKWRPVFGLIAILLLIAAFYIGLPFYQISES